MLGEDIVIAIAGAWTLAPISARARARNLFLAPSRHARVRARPAFFLPPSHSRPCPAHPPAAAAGNKCDMEKGRNVDKEEALRYTASVAGAHHLTSAKSGAGIAEAFTELMKRIVAKKKKDRGAGAPGAPQGRQTIMVIDEEPARKKASGGCC